MVKCDKVVTLSLYNKVEVMSMRKVLIVDDELKTRILISDFLKKEGYQILEARNGEEAVDLFFDNPSISLIILDVMMPIMNGWQVCEEIRKVSKVPIIMLTAKVNESDELKGFYRGADEYVKKPFSPSVLVARVNSLIKRFYSVDETIIKGVIHVNFDQFKLTIDEQDVKLSTIEFKLLEVLISNENRVLSRELILDKVWGYSYDGTDRTIDTHINRMRNKLGNAKDYITTIRGIGYKFEVTQ